MSHLSQNGKRATIVDVGKLAGVSTKTVSRVFNDAPHVSVDIQRRVRDAARTLNYHPNLLAQALVRRRSSLIGLIYENPSPSYVAELQMGVLERLKTAPYRLVVFPIQSVQANAGDVVGLLRSAALEGVILAPPAADHPVILAQLADAGIHCARIAPTRALDTGCVTLIDDVEAGREIAAHLLALGHRDIAIIKGDATHPAADARLLGYARAFAAIGAELRVDLIEPGLFTFDSGLAAGRRLFARSKRPTAILAQNDAMAMGALMAARESGLAVPGDLSIVGFDDAEVARIAWPPLTTIRQPVFEMAASATDMLIRAMDGGASDQRVEHSHRLIVRESTGPITGPVTGPVT